MSAQPVQLNDFKRLWADAGDAVVAATQAVGASGWYVLGKEVAAFEQELAAFAHSPFAVGCASGLDAIEIALRAQGIAPGDRVLTTPLSAFATTLAIIRAGAVPVFCDTDESGLLDLEAADAALREVAGIRYIVPVHLFGHALDLERLWRLSDVHDVQIVEDSAQAIGAAWRDKPVGSVSGVSATSFYPTKNLGALGDGGAVFCATEELAQTCRSLRDYGQTAKYEHTLLGLNSRLDELQAAILRQAMLPRLPNWLQRRAEVAERYRRGIANPGVAIASVPEGSQSSWHLFPVRVAADQRTGFMEHLKRHGIGCGIHYPILIPDQPALKGRSFERWGELSRARLLSQEGVSLPIHPYLHEEEVERVVSTVNSWSAR